MFPTPAVAGPSRPPKAAFQDASGYTSTSSSARDMSDTPIVFDNNPVRVSSLTGRVRRLSSRGQTLESTSTPLPDIPSPTAPTSNGLPNARLSSTILSRSTSSPVTPSRSETRSPLPEPPPQPPPKDITTDPAQVALLHSASITLSRKDQEAMRRLRSTMIEGSTSDDGSSVGTSSLSSSTFLGNGINAGRVTKPVSRSRGSTLSMQVLPDGVPGTAEEHVGSSSSPPARAIEIFADPPSNPQDVYSDDTDYVIAVIGHTGVGKSTIIQRATKAWGVSDPVSFEISTCHSISSSYSKVHPGGKIKNASTLQFLEMKLDALNLSDDGELWPDQLPCIHGAILCYDATDRESLVEIPHALNRISYNGVSTIMLACKSDPDAVLAIEAPEGNALGEPYNVGLIEVTQVTAEGKSKIRNGLRWLIYKLEQKDRRNQRKESATFTPPEPEKQPSDHTQHPPYLPSIARRHLELSVHDSDASSSTDRVMWLGNMEKDSVAVTENVTEPDNRSTSCTPQRMMQDTCQVRMEQPDSRQTDLPDRKAEDFENGGPSTEINLNEQPVTPSPLLYLGLQDLLNLVFTAIVSANDEPFIRAFFMTYRRFLRPSDLMGDFLRRMRDIEGYTVSKDVKHWSLMRITGSLIDWTSRYPGDFADSQTQSVYRETLELLLRHTFMAHLTADLITFEQRLADVTDLDASWSLQASSDIAQPMSIADESVVDLVNNKGIIGDFDSTINRSQVSIRGRPQSQHSSSSLTIDTHPFSLYLGRHRSDSETKVYSGNPSSEDGRFGRKEGDEIGYGRWSTACDYVLGTDARLLAVELTKMQMELFNAIEPRDVFRHGFGKEVNGPVGKAIAFFNYISRWTSTLILANVKAKHRARIYERFVLLAHHLRRLNNYDTLYALISGMRETSVHRLSHTHGLVQISPAMERDWQGHLKLMDPKGGYSSYRRAIQADISHGRSAIPLLTTILGAVNRLQAIRLEDRRADDTVQWDKFARFGEILSIIPECQSKGSAVSGKINPQVRRMIEETPVIVSEDDLFERSRMLEPTGGVQAGKVMKRFANLGF